MKLADYEKFWFESLISSIDHSEKLGINKGRLELYQGFVKNHYIGSLQKMFPRISEVFSPEWEKWSEDYYNDYPPIHFELNSLTLNFPKFLKKLVGKGSLPEHIVELAEYELAEFFIYTSPENYQSIERIDEELVLNKSLMIFEFEYRIGEWVKAMDENSQAKEVAPERGDNILAISRDNQNFRCVMSSLNQIDLLLIELLKEVPMKIEETFKEFYSIDENLKQFDQSLLQQRIDFFKLQHILL